MTSDPARGPDDIIASYMQAKKEMMRRHAELRDSSTFKDAIQQTHKIARDFQTAIGSIGLMSTRWDGFREQVLSVRLQDHYLQSVIAIVSLINEGLLGPARREMRFIVETSIKAWACDAADPGSAVRDKVENLSNLGRRGFGRLVDGLKPRLISGKVLETFPERVKALYVDLCSHVHLSKSQIATDFEAFERGEHFGYESVDQLAEINTLLRDVLDLALLSQFETFDHGLVGDIFVVMLDEEKEWCFHGTHFISSVSSFFDYKHERQMRRPD